MELLEQTILTLKKQNLRIFQEIKAKTAAPQPPKTMWQKLWGRG
jgi:hypothetical protein